MQIRLLALSISAVSWATDVPGKEPQAMLRGEKNFLFGHLTDTWLKPDTRLPCAETLQPTVRALAVKTARLRTARFGGRSENTKLPSLHLPGGAGDTSQRGKEGQGKRGLDESGGWWWGISRQQWRCWASCQTRGEGSKQARGDVKEGSGEPVKGHQTPDED